MSRALLIIDVQNDFCEGGALGVAGGAGVAGRISNFLAKYVDDYDLVVASRDWHDGAGDNGGHFATDAPPDFVDTWPAHCIAGTPGADYHPDLDAGGIDVHIRKGQGRPAYSIFEGATEQGQPLVALLEQRGITDVDVVGIATDHCVRASALDALAAGEGVRVLTDLIAGVAPASSAAALGELHAAGVVLDASGSLALG